MSREHDAVRSSQGHDDFDFEDRPGIPGPLPEGEALLWQGSPDWKTLAMTPFHARKVALWFGAIALFELVWTLAQGGTVGAALPGVVKTLAVGAVGVGLLVLLAYLNGRVTIYTITSRRLLIRFGVALQITMNLPFSQVREANVKVGADGVGDIPIALADARRVGYITLWPHVRPWRLTRPEPMLRALPEAAKVAALLGNAMHAAAGERSAMPPGIDADSTPAIGASVRVPTAPTADTLPAAADRSADRASTATVGRVTSVSS